MKIELNEDVCQQLVDYLNNQQGFQSPEEFVNFILRAMLSEVDFKVVDKKPEVDEKLDIIKQRLQDLGYLD